MFVQALSLYISFPSSHFLLCDCSDRGGRINSSWHPPIFDERLLFVTVDSQICWKCPNPKGLANIPLEVHVGKTVKIRSEPLSDMN